MTTVSDARGRCGILLSESAVSRGPGTLFCMMAGGKNANDLERSAVDRPHSGACHSALGEARGQGTRIIIAALAFQTRLAVLPDSLARAACDIHIVDVISICARYSSTAELH